ncbi:MAG: CARDB domain-containing protein, partial [Dehalococcoidia bacterium]|nr:CARDB domain-containing protein [Dehalococcoidia bacterium]
KTATVSVTVARDAGSSQAVSEALKADFKVLKPAAFVLSNLAVTPSQVQVGKTVTVTVDVTNTGEVTGSHTVALNISGAAEASQDVTVAGGKTATVSFTVARKAGNYQAETEGLQASFEVIAPPAITVWLFTVIGVVVIIGLFLFRRRRKKVACVFPHSDDEFATADDLRRFLTKELPDREGEYRLRKLGRKDKDFEARVTAGSLVLFRKGEVIVGDAVVQQAIIELDPPEENIYYYKIVFEPASVRAYQTEVTVDRIEKWSGRKLQPGLYAILGLRRDYEKAFLSHTEPPR